MAYTKFEYDPVNFSGFSAEKIKSTLTERGDNGWELCAHCADADGKMFMFIFKRQLPMVIKESDFNKYWPEIERKIS